jgi:hypothetical protein
MSELKYARNIITELKPIIHPGAEPRQTGEPGFVRVGYIDDEVIKGAFYMESCWFLKSSDTGPTPHTHEFDEILGFIGHNPRNPRDLGGEFELWLDDEKYTLTQSCMVYIPKGLKHCPMIARKVVTPILHFSVGTGIQYQKSST